MRDKTHYINPPYYPTLIQNTALILFKMVFIHRKITPSSGVLKLRRFATLH